MTCLYCDKPIKYNNLHLCDTHYKRWRNRLPMEAPPRKTKKPAIVPDCLYCDRKAIYFWNHLCHTHYERWRRRIPMEGRPLKDPKEVDRLARMRYKFKHEMLGLCKYCPNPVAEGHKKCRQCLDKRAEGLESFMRQKELMQAAMKVHQDRRQHGQYRASLDWALQNHRLRFTDDTDYSAIRS